MSELTTAIPVTLSNGTVIQVETSLVRGEVAVSAGRLPEFNQVISTIEGIAEEMNQLIKRVQPQEATVEFGVEIGVESGKLTTLLVKGSGKANIKIKLKWGEVS